MMQEAGLSTISKFRDQENLKGNAHRANTCITGAIMFNIETEKDYQFYVLCMVCFLRTRLLTYKDITLS